MADRKISELTNITGTNVDDANDEIAIVDASASQTKAITRAELFSSVSAISVDGNITVGGTVDGRDVAADGSKLDGIEAGADVTDTANVTAAGALMDSELTEIAAVKALDQGVATTDSPDFAGLNVNGTVTADGLNVDGSTLLRQTLTNSVALDFQNSSGQFDLVNTNNYFRFRAGAAQQEVLRVGATGDISFYEDTGTTPKFFWDASTERLGIGNSSPTTALDVTGTVTADGLTVGSDATVYDLVVESIAPIIRLSDTSASATHDLISNNAELRVNASSILSLRTGNAPRQKIASNGDISFYEDTGTTPKFFWDASAESLGIGTSSPSEKLDVSGNVTISGSLSKGSGSFKIDHPVKPDTHHLVHSFIEGPQADNLYRGKVVLADGKATVNLDEAGRMTEGTFVALNGNVQCFTTNEDGWTQVRGKVEGNILTIEAQDSACTDEVSWLVIGERHDKHMIDANWTDENGRVITEPSKEKTQ